MIEEHQEEMRPLAGNLLGRGNSMKRNGLYALQNYSYSSSTGNLSSKADVIYTYGDSNHTHAVTAMGSGSDSYISLLE
ncbi:MAG: hypothetical protein A2032_03895 [Chloroflexi bacterium RBG_19FT_COMBO_49_13]|nr:MAG: hypothetical protein A2032_03895 [Chloroflexi bacterium RBG_19FT_COMBO_49_13]